MATPVVSCLHCGNDDLRHMTAWDRPRAIRRVREVTEDGHLLVDADYETEYDGSETVRLFCDQCGKDFDSPLKIDYT